MSVVLNVNSTQPPNNKTADTFGQPAQARQTDTRRSSPQHSSYERVVDAGLAAIAAAATRRGKRTKKVPS